jgi:hypothetical protein
MKKIATLITIVLASLGNIAGAQQPTKLITGIGADSSGSVSNLGTYILNLYKWGIGLAALSALAFLVFGSIQKILSAGNLASAESANERISSAIYGLILLLAAVTILYSINSRITDLSGPDVETITREAKDRQLLDAQIAKTKKDLQEINEAVAGLEKEKLVAQYAKNHPGTSESVKAAVDDVLSDLGSDPRNPSELEIQIAKNNLIKMGRDFGEATTTDLWLKNLGIDKIDLADYFKNHPTIKYQPNKNYPDDWYRQQIGVDIFISLVSEVKEKTSATAWEKIVDHPELRTLKITELVDANTLFAQKTELEKKLTDLQAKL